MSTPDPRGRWRRLNGNPRLGELIAQYPSEWEDAGRELVAALEDGRAQRLSELAAGAQSAAEIWRRRVRASRDNVRVIEAALPRVARSRMTLLALEQCYLAAATGKAGGKIRFNLINGFIVQRLLFSTGLTRKPASAAWFRFWWRFVTQKRVLMPLVQPKGIYCFYARPLIEGLANLIEGRTCLEIAAGDGTLTRFLADQGVSITATDDHSWSHVIRFPETVEKLAAKEALARYQPRAVVCSWPPPANGFERHVFATGSVELYVVIGSRFRFAAGNWDAYANRGGFEMSTDERLSDYVLPPELESAVLIFRRQPGSR